MVFCVTNSLKLTNVLILLKFFFNNALQGILNRPFFKKKVNIYGFVCMVLIIYIGYFYLNIVEVSELSENITYIDEDEYIMLSKITMSSFFNIILILSVGIILLINLTINLNKNSVFFAKTLPFLNKEVIVSNILFKLSVALIIFEIVVVMVVPALKLMSRNLFTMVFIFSTLHVLFIAVFFVIELIYSSILRDKIGSVRWMLSFALDVLMVIFMTTHFVVTRFKVDAWIALQQASVFQMTSILFVSSLLIGLISFLINIKYISVNNIYVRSNYFKFGFPTFNIILATTLPAIIRSKNFLYFIAFLLVVSISSYVQVGVSAMFQILMFVLPLFGVIAINYADSTDKVRKFFNLYRITPVRELSSILVVGLILLIPTLILGFVEGQNDKLYLYGINIFIVSILIGFLFPKSQSNINETIASVLAIIVIILLSLMISLKGVLYLCLLFLLCILYFVLKKEYEVEK